MLVLSEDFLKILHRRDLRVIVLDLDEVMFQTVQALVAASRIFGFVDFDFTDYNLGIPRPLFFEIHDYAVRQGMFRKLKPYRRVVMLAQQLHALGYTVRFVTHRASLQDDVVLHEQIVEDTLASLTQHGLPDPHLTVFAAGSKLVHCQELEADLVIEDKLETVLEINGQLNKRGGIIHAIVVNRTWNQGDYPHRIKCPSHILPFLTGPP